MQINTRIILLIPKIFKNQSTVKKNKGVSPCRLAFLVVLLFFRGVVVAFIESKIQIETYVHRILGSVILMNSSGFLSNVATLARVEVTSSFGKNSPEISEVKELFSYN